MMLDIAGVSFSYGSSDVLSDVSFSAEPGDIVSILGPNGVGKTTLLKCINRLHTPTCGIVKAEGVDLSRLIPNDVAKRIGYVPQRAHVSGSTVFESVLIGRRPHIGANITDSDVRLAARIIELMGLSSISEKHVNEISGGEYQLVQISRALVQQPRVILMDEPTSNLDLANQKMVMEKLAGVVRANGMCAVMTNHDLNLAIRYCNRFIMMSDGHIHAAGGREIVTAENISAVYNVDADVHDIDGTQVVVLK